MSYKSNWRNSVPDKDPMSYTLITYSWVFLISIWGGLSGYIRKIKTGQSKFSMAELVGELCISAFVGVVTFFMCESANFSPVMSAAIIGMSAHMGSRSIFVMESFIESLVKAWLGK